MAPLLGFRHRGCQEEAIVFDTESIPFRGADAMLPWQQISIDQWEWAGLPWPAMYKAVRPIASLGGLERGGIARYSEWL